MAEKKQASKTEAQRDDTGKRMSPEEIRAQNEGTGELEDGRILLTNDSGEVKKVTEEEWGNEERQAELLKQGWHVVGEDAAED